MDKENVTMKKQLLTIVASVFLAGSLAAGAYAQGSDPGNRAGSGTPQNPPAQMGGESSTMQGMQGAAQQSWHQLPHMMQMTQVGNRQFETVLTGNQIYVYEFDAAGQKMQSIDDGTGTAVVHFPDGSTQNVQLTKTKIKGQDTLMGTFQPASSQAPTSVDLQLSNLGGDTPQASFTTDFTGQKMGMGTGMGTGMGGAAGTTPSGTSESQYGTSSTSPSGMSNENMGRSSTSPSGTSNENMGTSSTTRTGRTSGRRGLPGTASALPLTLIAGLAAVGLGFGIRAARS